MSESEIFPQINFLSICQPLEYHSHPTFALFHLSISVLIWAEAYVQIENSIRE